MLQVHKIYQVMLVECQGGHEGRGLRMKGMDTNVMIHEYDG